MTDDPSTRPPVDPWADSSPPVDTTAGHSGWAVRQPIARPLAPPMAAASEQAGYVHPLPVGPPSPPAMPPPAPLLRPAGPVVRRRRRWPWVLGGFALVTMLLCVAATVFTAPIRAQWPAEIVVGDRVAGLAPNRGDLVRTVADTEIARLREKYNTEGVAVEWLGDPDNSDRGVLLMAAVKLILDPAAELRAAIQEQNAALTDVRSEEPGPLGGLVGCGKSVDDGGLENTVCIWADHGSVGFARIYQGGTRQQAVQLFRQIRAEVLVRS